MLNGQKYFGLNPTSHFEHRIPLMPHDFSAAELEAFLDEGLPATRMAAIEDVLRHDAALQRRLADVVGRRDAGVHSIGEIWRRHRLSCPTREQLGSYLLRVLPAELADYIRFHLETIECRYCLANIDDLGTQQSATASETTKRRKRYFQSSAGLLRPDG
jgi:hypothetical protein